LWLGRVRRGFEEIKSDVSRELHNEEVMRALRESRDEVQELTDVSSALSLSDSSEENDSSAPENEADITAPESESNVPPSSQAAVENAGTENAVEKGA
jgi:sec-independent protein translocase protein TatB